MSTSILATRYAEAFVAATGDQAEGMLDQLQALAQVYAESDPVRQLLTSPVIRKKDRAQGLTLLARFLQLAEPVQRLLGLLTSNSRGSLVPELAEATAGAVDRKLGRQHLVVATARTWSDAEKQSLLKKLDAGNARIDWQVDEALLGGVRVQRDDLVWDGSVQKQMSRLQEILTR